MSLILAILPILLVIAAGYLLVRTDLLPQADWTGIETLSFRVLIPALLILAITRADLSWQAFGPFMIVILITFAAMVALGLLLRLLPKERLGNPAFTSVFQAGLRWNAFVALAAAEQFAGPTGVAMVAVAIALLIPAINVACIVVLTTFGPQRASLRGVLVALAKNPLVQACVIGLTLYTTGTALPHPVEQALELIGDAALAVGLLAVGAGISLKRLSRWNWKVAVALFARPFLGPLLFAGVAGAMGLGALQTFAGVLVFAAPSASNGYVVAKQMGGDADLYADALTWQVLLSLAVLPLWAWALLG